MTSLEGTLTTLELLAKIGEELGLQLSRKTVHHWVSREENPLPTAYRGKNGQAHRFDWVSFLSWYEAESDRANAAQGVGTVNIDSLDWHGARTVTERAKAKMALIDAAAKEKRYGDIDEMTLTAEDCARHAVIVLRSLPARLAPKLAIMTDEIQIDRLLDSEIRAICQAIEESARQALGADTEEMAA